MPLWRDDNTDRLFVDILVDKHKHTVKARLLANSPASAFTEAQERIALLYKAVENFLGADFKVLGARKAVFGQAESTPIVKADGWADITGGRVAQPYNTAKYLNMVGKAPGRSHTSIKIWGVELVAINSASDDFRFTTAEIANLAGAQNVLNNPTPLFVCRNGQQATFYSEALARVSAWWQTELRK